MSSTQTFDAPARPPSRLCHVTKLLGKLGVVLRSGMIVYEIHKDYPAHLSGLRVGDRIIEVNDVNIENYTYVQALTSINTSPKNLTLRVVADEEYKKYKERDAEYRKYKKTDTVVQDTSPKTPETPFTFEILRML